MTTQNKNLIIAEVEQVKEYYLNSGFPQYWGEPFLSEYNNSDWIEHANESDLEL